MKKYEIAIYKEAAHWDAILICNCGDRPEQRLERGPDFHELLSRVSKVLSEHENREK